MSAAAVATSAALAMSAVEAGAADAARPMADGTAPMASQVASVTAVPGVTTAISPPIDVDGKLFYGTAAAGGGKLWEITGAGAAPTLIKQITGTSEAAPADLTNVGGHLWFEADGQLWKSNGTPASTVRVDGKVDPTAIVDAGGTVFIETSGGLWKSNGTSASTREVKAIKLGTKPDIAAVSGRVYFAVPGKGTGYAEDPRLWSSNGSPAGTVAVKERNSYGAISALYDPTELTTVGGHLYFSAFTVSRPGPYLGLSEASGTSARQIEPYGTDLANVNGSLYFFDFDKPHNCGYITGESCTPSTGYALWKGTTPLFDFEPNISAAYSGDDQKYAPYTGALTAVGSTLFFVANLGGSTQLWREDGDMETGLADVGPLVPRDLTNVNGTLFFTGNEGTNPGQVYESNGEAPAQDGTDAGTFAVTDFPATTTTPGDLVNVGGTLYFTANDGSAGGYGLWELPTEPQ